VAPFLEVALPEGTPGLGAVHSLVRMTTPEWTVLRPSWFMQNFTATGNGRVAFIDAADIAAVAQHVLTGPEALSYADAAEILTRQTARSFGAFAERWSLTSSGR
jgi:uncharacterized protein YbjT (DUF2867 family)